jgi:diguanylate cyclase (GGDEF)-like protein
MEQGESLCDQLGITADELKGRLAFLSFSPEDQENLTGIGDVIRLHVDDIIGAFYDHLNGFDEMRRLLSEPGLVERLKTKQREYLLTLGQSGGAVSYAEGRLRIGLAHERVGLKQKWYLGAYSALFRLIVLRLAEEYSGDARRLVSVIQTVDKILRFDEIFVVDTYYHMTTKRLAESLQELSSAHDQLMESSRLDPLTQVSNRRALMERLELEFQRCRRYGHPLGVLFLDVDHFKAVNDRYGHTLGDSMLQRIVHVIGGITRPSDIFGRYGGEEFVVGLVECGSEAATQTAERIRMAIERSRITWQGQEVGVTASIGIAMLTPDVSNVDTLIRCADRALYRAKAGGRNRVQIFRDADA